MTTRRTPAQHITYAQLLEKTCRLANVLKAHRRDQGRPGHVIYMPMIPEAAYAMLACARIGAIHSIVFGGFSPDALANRIKDSEAKIVITADWAPRGGKKTPEGQHRQGDAACQRPGEGAGSQSAPGTRPRGSKGATSGDLTAEMAAARPYCPYVEVDGAEDPLFILYTSGSTGKPKGVVHTTGGYLVYAAMTHQYVFDYHDGDVFWCTADVGWVTGHSYIVYGPLANGATTADVRGRADLSRCGRFWEVCDKHKVNQFYTAPTAIRALMGQGPNGSKSTTCPACAARLGRRADQPRGLVWYDTHVGKGAARSSTPGGRPRPAAT
jgi:acetyl-CoA synthetase